MPLTSLLRQLALLAFIATVAACTTVTTSPQSGTHQSAQPSISGSDTGAAQVTVEGAETTLPVESGVVPPPPSSNAAVLALLDTAQSDSAAGRLPSASASLERALRIEPRNPHLWHQLAKVKLQKGDYLQAESLAARSNSWAGSNKALQALNWRLISEARALRGDNSGAKAALARAKTLEASRQ